MELKRIKMFTLISGVWLWGASAINTKHWCYLLLRMVSSEMKYCKLQYPRWCLLCFQQRYIQFVLAVATIIYALLFVCGCARCTKAEPLSRGDKATPRHSNQGRAVPVLRDYKSHTLQTQFVCQIPKDLDVPVGSTCVQHLNWFSYPAYIQTWYL
jgi:hypothetical protein